MLRQTKLATVPRLQLLSGAVNRFLNRQALRIRSMSSALEPEGVQVELRQLCKAITLYASAHPAVKGTERLQKRAQRDLASVNVIVQEQHSSLGSLAGWVTSSALTAQLQGACNNVRGMRAELDVAQQADKVISLGTRFYSQVSAGEETSKKGKQSKATNLVANHFVPSGESVEVDVVAQQGLAWIEVKAHEPFDLNSSQWLGNPGHFKGLEQQALQQLTVARATCNIVQWRSPVVMMHFPQGAHPDVRNELQTMGILVSGPGRFDPALLPPMPAVPKVANLDVTTLCALVSEVSHTDPAEPQLQAWAQRVVHWQDSLTAEAQEPMLPMLQPYMDGKTMIVSDAAALQFQKLVDQYGGHNERCRWQTLQKKLAVFTCDATPNSAPNLEDRVSWADELQELHRFDFLRNRVFQLQAVSAAQRMVFALGDDQQALTLTANGRAVDFAARQGIRLESYVHRAVWLTGL